MVESLKELNKKCQKPNYKEVGNWMVRHIERDLALYVTWVVLHTKITANQVTFGSIIVGLFSAFAFAFPYPWGFLIGAILLQFWYLLDHVDGQVARYRQSASLTGVFFDYITHYIVHSLLFLGIGVGAYLNDGNPIILFLSSIAALFMAFLSMFYDAKYKSFFQWFSSKKMVRVEFQWEEDNKKNSEGRQNVSWVKRVFVILCKLTEIHVIMNLLTFLAVIWFFVPDLHLNSIVIFFYSLLLPFVFIARVTYVITKSQIDNDFKQTVKINV